MGYRVKIRNANSSILYGLLCTVNGKGMSLFWAASRKPTIASTGVFLW